MMDVTDLGGMPNFLMIGKAKSGTTALYYALKQHPQIYMSPVKEPGFFTFEGLPPTFTGPNDQRYNTGFITTLGAYQALFAGAQAYPAIGEASTTYLAWYRVRETAENIRRYLPNVRLVAILRHPVDQAYSIFNFRRQLGREPLSDFAQAFAADGSPRRANWSPGCHYRRNGFYHEQLRYYYDRFARESIRVFLYEDWQTNPEALLMDLFRFLQVDELIKPGMFERRNVTRVPRIQALHSLLFGANPFKAIAQRVLPFALRRRLSRRLQAANASRPRPLNGELRRELTGIYREDILALQDLIGRDLSHWLDV